MGSWYVVANYTKKEYLQPNCSWSELFGNQNMMHKLFHLLDGRTYPEDATGERGSWNKCDIRIVPDFEGDGYYDGWKKIELENGDYDHSDILNLLNERIEIIKQRQMIEAHFKPCKKMMNLEAKYEVENIIKEVKRRGIE